MSDGTRVTGARAKGVSAAEKVKAGKPGKGNPYSDARPAMQKAWNEGYASAAAFDSEPAPAKPAKAAKVKALAAQTPFTVDEVAAAAESDDILLGGD